MKIISNYDVNADILTIQYEDKKYIWGTTYDLCKEISFMHFAYEDGVKYPIAIKIIRASKWNIKNSFSDDNLIKYFRNWLYKIHIFS